MKVGLFSVFLSFSVITILNAAAAQSSPSPSPAPCKMVGNVCVSTGGSTGCKAPKECVTNQEVTATGRITKYSCGGCVDFPPGTELKF